MVTIIRDRVQDDDQEGHDARAGQGGEADPRLRPRYGATTGPWTTDMFVEAVYMTLGGGKKPAAAPAPRGGGSEGRRRIRYGLIVSSSRASCASRTGGGTAGQPPTARAAAPIDLTGTGCRSSPKTGAGACCTPPKGDYASVPLNDAARRVADAWDPGEGRRGGRAVRGVRRGRHHARAGRVRITWHDDTTLKIETEAGTQTRLLNFVAASAARRAVLAGHIDRQLADSPAADAAAVARRGAAHCESSRPIARGVFAKERRPLQRKRSPHRVHQPHHRGERRCVARGDDDGRGSAVSHDAVRDQLALQESP